MAAKCNKTALNCCATTEINSLWEKINVRTSLDAGSVYGL